MARIFQKISCFMVVVLCCTSLAEAADHEAHHDALIAYVDAWNTGNLDRLQALVASDFQRHAGPDESCASRTELADIIAGAREIWKGLRISIDDSMATADGGALRGGFYGVHRKTSGIIEFPTMSIFRFAEGKIAEEWIIGDNFLSLMALGYELVPPGFEIGPAGEKPLAAVDTGDSK